MPVGLPWLIQRPQNPTKLKTGNYAEIPKISFLLGWWEDSAMRGTMGLYGLWPVVCFWAFCLEQATAGVLKPVSGPEDLNLTGTIYYGINLGGTSDVLVGGKWLESDNDGDPAPVGYTITLPTNIYTSGWGYGSLTDPGLQKTYDSMRWTGWPNALELSFRYLPPGQPVRVQLLLSEGYHNSSQRRFDIQIEGNTEFSNVDPWSLWGYKNPGLAETVVTVSQDGILNVRLIGNVGAPDKNPVLDGIFVSSAEPIVPSWPRVQPVSVTASAQYSSQYPATAVLDGSWAERRPPEYPVADYWLLPNGQTGYLTFDMGQPVHLAMIGLHNTNNAQYGDRGTIAYHIDVSSDPNFTTYETLAAGTLKPMRQAGHTSPSRRISCGNMCAFMWMILAAPGAFWGKCRGLVAAWPKFSSTQCQSQPVGCSWPWAAWHWVGWAGDSKKQAARKEQR